MSDWTIRGSMDGAAMAEGDIPAFVTVYTTDEDVQKFPIGSAVVVTLATADPHGWVSVDDRMPEVGVYVDTKSPRGREYAQSDDGVRWLTRGRLLIEGVTHWRIPTPGPSSTGGEK